MYISIYASFIPAFLTTNLYSATFSPTIIGSPFGVCSFLDWHILENYCPIFAGVCSFLNWCILENSGQILMEYVHF
jgi:hypothetical protein